MQIKYCEKNCACPQKKKYHFKKYFGKKRHYAGKKKNTFRKKKWKFLRRKQFKGKTLKACFVCRRPGHFTRNCPKNEKAAKLLEQAQIHAEDIPFSDIESLFSLDDEYSPQVLAVVTYSTLEGRHVHFEHKEFFILLRCIRSPIQMKLSIHIWMSLGYLVIILLPWQNPLIRIFSLK